MPEKKRVQMGTFIFHPFKSVFGGAWHIHICKASQTNQGEMSGPLGLGDVLRSRSFTSSPFSPAIHFWPARQGAGAEF